MSGGGAPRILLGVTGSVAAFKAPDIVRELREGGADVACVMTPAAERFVGRSALEAMSGNPVGIDLFDPRGSAALPSWAREGPLARMPYHLAVAECADLLLVAPASANTMAKVAAGIADNLLTTALLATSRPVVLAPAMNPRMWEHPATRASARRLAGRGVHLIEPARGKMAWEEEEEGAGRLPEPAEVARRAFRVLATCRELRGAKVVVSAGGTEEPIDAVRVVANRSSGRMGAALAEEARARGADVVLVAGRMSVAPPGGVRVVDARTAGAMGRAMLAEARDADLVLMAAAVADWRPKDPAPRKLPKAEGPPAIAWEATEDVLARLREAAPRAFRVGFALETEDPLARARAKLEAKGLDLIVVNDATEPGAGFDVETNRVRLLARDGSVRELPLLPKREVAARILDRVAELRRSSAAS